MNKFNTKHSPRIMEVIYSFEIGGSEMLAVGISTYMKEHNANICVCATHSKEGPISEILNEAKIDCFAMDVESQSRIGRRIALYKLFKKENIEVLHIHHVSIFALCFLPAKLAGVKKIIVTEHNEIDMEKSPRLKKLAKKICPKIYRTTVIHTKLAEYFINEIGLSVDKIKIIENGVDIDKFCPREPNEALKEELGLCKDDHVIGCIGRLHEFKNHKLLIRAVRELSDNEISRLKVLIVGDGALRDELIALVKEYDLENSIIFLGERSDIPEILNIIDFLTLTSSTEGVPMIILEAMSSGVPCIATDVGGISEIIDENCGVVVPSENIHELAKNISKFCNSPALLKSMELACRQKALKFYDKNVMFNDYKNLLVY